jgi:hypothetical protein
MESVAKAVALAVIYAPHRAINTILLMNAMCKIEHLLRKCILFFRNFKKNFNNLKN